MAGQKQLIILDPEGDLLVVLHKPSTIPTESKSSQMLDSEPMELESSPVKAAPEPESSSSKEAAATTQQVTPVPEKWTFKVSSKHLTLASGYFKTMLDGPWHEANKVQEDGLRHFVVEDFNLEAFSIVLSIIHGKNSRVPLTVKLELLLEISRVVNHLRCSEAMSSYTVTWTRHLEPSIPVKCTIKLLHWISIAAIFQEHAIFHRCTRTAIIQSRSNIFSLGLPALASVRDEINRRRILILDMIFRTIYNLKDNMTEKTLCSFDCDAFLVGVLTKRLHKMSPGSRPQSPYVGLSIGSVIKSFNSLPAFDRMPLRREGITRGRLPHCGFKTTIDNLNQYEKKIEGLMLKGASGIKEAECLNHIQGEGKLASGEKATEGCLPVQQRTG
ncbi:hypothetical protein F5Y09DRAFT_266096 [Xylaria sp. FL1042]|nr:hypothetical protein F5Y09DRAFT_266096 [Xylaria sp. FL1042]